MLTRRIIPCLDVDRGRVIRGVKFSADKVVGDPVELAAEYNRQGADELVFYDITASAEDRGTIMDVLHRTAGEVFIPLTVGGGVRSADDMKELLRAGADKVSVNSQAVANPRVIAEGADRFGSQCIVLSMDVRWNTEREFYEIVTHGGRRPTGMEALEWACQGVALGAGELVVNSIDADGTRDGYELKLTRMIAEAVPVPVVASGGAGELDHLYQVLSEGKADAALAASIFHFGDFSIGDAKRHLAQLGIPVPTVTPDELEFDSSGLIPAIVQHVGSGQILMVGFANQEAVHKTLETRRAWFFSRSRRQLWQKGETSGHVLELKGLRVDCDADALIYLCEPVGPTCHTGQPSCFFNRLDEVPAAETSGEAAAHLFATIQARQSADPDTSYVARLVADGVDRIAKKIGEEATEVVIAAKNESREELAHEIADLWFHTFVLLAQRGMTPEDVWAELRGRRRG